MNSGMAFRSLRLVNFRGYSDARAEFHPRLNCISGRNGAGKTNLVDALYYCCFGKSYLTPKDTYVLREGAGFMRLESVISEGEETWRVVVKLPAGGRKELLVNDRPVDRLTDYAGRFPAVMIAPDDNQIVLGGSELRRRFVDASVGQYDRGYLEALVRYTRLLKRRNALLKQGRSTGRCDRWLIESLDEQMAGPADLLHQGRLEFLETFLPLFSARYRAIAGEAEKPGITYRSGLDGKPAAEVFAGGLSADMAAGRSLTGVHRDDLEFLLGEAPLKQIGSQGQQKSFLVALKLAQYEIIARQTGRKPLLLLDDLFDKFDASRVDHLVGLIAEGFFGQVFITDARASRLESLLKKRNLAHAAIEVSDAAISYG